MKLGALHVFDSAQRQNASPCHAEQANAWQPRAHCCTLEQRIDRTLLQPEGKRRFKMMATLLRHTARSKMELIEHGE